jgi:TetR/AcrR family transcriptional regulator
MPKTMKRAVQSREKPIVASRRRRPKEVKDRILKAAVAAFAKNGFVGSRMRSIADDAGITIQLLTHHVKSKENLWKIMLEELKLRYRELESRHPALPAGSTAADRLRITIADQVRFTASIPELHRLVILEAGSPNPRLLALIEAFGRDIFVETCNLIKEAQREGAIKNISPARLRYAITAMASVPFSVAAEYEYLTSKNPFSSNEIERIIEMINELVFI